MPGLEVFPPLESTREGDTIIADRLVQSELIAAAAAQYVFDHFADVTGCDADVDCVRAFVAGSPSAPTGARSPAPELDSLNQEISDLIALGSSRAGGRAVRRLRGADGAAGSSTAPSSALRRGSPTATDVALDAVRDGEPALVHAHRRPARRRAARRRKHGDAGDRRGARRRGRSPAGDRGHATATYATRSSSDLRNQPAGERRDRSAQGTGFGRRWATRWQTESRLFLDEVLWHGQLGDMLTSTTSFVNTDLATCVYGIPLPAGATATDFVRVELPADQRAGLLTRAGFITAHARPDSATTSRAGSWSPSALGLRRAAAPSPIRSRPRRRQSSMRARLDAAGERPSSGWRCPSAVACHVHMDPYGLALEELRRHRAVPDAGRAGATDRHVGDAAAVVRQPDGHRRRRSLAEDREQPHVHRVPRADLLALRTADTLRARRRRWTAAW